MSDRGRGQASGCPLQQMLDRVRLGSGPLRPPESPPHPSPIPSQACSPYALVAREQRAERPGCVSRPHCPVATARVGPPPTFPMKAECNSGALGLRGAQHREKRKVGQHCVPRGFHEALPWDRPWPPDGRPMCGAC